MVLTSAWRNGEIIALLGNLTKLLSSEMDHSDSHKPILSGNEQNIQSLSLPKLLHSQQMILLLCRTQLGHYKFIPFKSVMQKSEINIISFYIPELSVVKLSSQLKLLERHKHKHFLPVLYPKFS